MLAKSLFAKRNFSTHLSRDKLTSFDYMWYDKLNFLKVGGWWYALLGVGNIMAYGLSHLMTKENYEYHFAYKGEGKMFNWIKSQVGCNTIDSVIWTAPSLILGNYFLMKRCGPIVATKLFATNLACVFMFQSSFHPNSGFAKRLIPGMPYEWYCSPDYKYYMGADFMAGGLLYFMAIYNRYWFIALPFMAFDLCYYGPQAGGMISAGFATAMSIL